MLTTQQVEAIATKVNAKVNVPVIGEKFEFFIFKMVIKIVDAKLEEILSLIHISEPTRP